MENMESGLTMLLHSVVIGLLLFVIMAYVLKQKQEVAIDRTLVISGLVLVYMVAFGHGLPTKINKNLKFL
jgi:uncharacterized membrane-anchored protein